MVYVFINDVKCLATSSIYFVYFKKDLIYYYQLNIELKAAVFTRGICSKY